MLLFYVMRPLIEIRLLLMFLKKLNLRYQQKDKTYSYRNLSLLIIS